MKILNQIGPL